MHASTSRARLPRTCTNAASHSSPASPRISSASITSDSKPGLGGRGLEQAAVPKIGDSGAMTTPLLRAVDAVTFHVPDLDEGIAFYVDRLGHGLLWRNNDIGAAALALRESSTEIVLTTQHSYEPNWLVDSADEAAESIEAAGGRVLSPAVDIPVGRLAVVEDPFGNVLVLIDLSQGRYAIDDHGNVTAVVADP